MYVFFWILIYPLYVFLKSFFCTGFSFNSATFCHREALNIREPNLSTFPL